MNQTYLIFDVRAQQWLSPTGVTQNINDATTYCKNDALVECKERNKGRALFYIPVAKLDALYTIGVPA